MKRTTKIVRLCLSEAYSTKIFNIMAGKNIDEGEVLMLQGFPFHMKQPKERMDRVFEKYETVLRKALGDQIVAVCQMGSGAIPGMVGSPMTDILLAMKNYPPTKDQIDQLKQLNIVFMGDGSSPHDPNDTWFHNVDFPSQEDFEEFMINGKFPPGGHLGRLLIHFVHFQNPWIESALCFVEYLSQNKEAFSRYRDVKIEGATLQTGPMETKEDNTYGLPSSFLNYKLHKVAVVKELTEESKIWREAGNFKLPQVFIDVDQN